MSRHRIQRGFTLVELVVVIAVLGILAAVALPRFTDLQSQARKAKAQGLLGSVRAASAITKAAALANNTDCTAATGQTVSSEGANNVTLAYCYPTASATGITLAANIATNYDDVTISYSGTTATVQVNGAGGSGLSTCSVSYTSPASAGAQPVISSDTSAC